ncbi:MAG: hypothetical protein C0467_11365 [Planctomycetaceae bacterium]|nr:hypothetical protein [Planctomycetaceae bacterium]
MPLRDHFRPHVSKRSSWEGLNGMLPGEIVQHFRKTLPPGFRAEPRVRHPIDPDEEDEYAVHVYDTEGEQTLVASKRLSVAEP